ncbi:MAG: ABC transporter permease [Planctomycetia bacterium]|nr:ABC transporter permease [Planctomycetia bacterium]
MIAYIFRRILIGFFTLFLVTMIVYGMIRNMPGNPVAQMEAQDPSRVLSEEDKQRLMEIYGLDKPWYEAYWSWLGKICTGDLGVSIKLHENVSSVIAVRIGPTLLLSITSLCLMYILAIPIGFYSVVRSGKRDERIASFVLYMFYSIPSFVMGVGLLVVFYQWLEWLPPGIMSDDYDSFSYFGKLFDVGKHMILPVFCYTYGGLASFSRFIKANMEEVIRQDYIRTARAKGLSNYRVIVHHAFRNTLIPFVTMVGLALPGLLSGAIILEQIFEWPGMGSLFFECISNRDYPVIMGMILIFSIMTLLGQLLADILYTLVDPRVTYK